MTDEDPGVCIVTQPRRVQVAKDHAHDLADLIAELTTVAVLTANLPDNSPLRDHHEVVEVSSTSIGEHVLVEAVRFLLYQLRLCRAIYAREEDVLLFFGTTSYLLPIVFSRLVGKQVLILPRGDVPLSLRLRWEDSMPAFLAGLLASLVSLLERINYRLADAILAYTPSMAEQLGLDRYAGKLYPTAARFIDTDQFSVQVPYEEREQAVGFIGRLDAEKRVPELAAAAKHLPDEIRFVFVGDGDYRELLEAELAEEIETGSVEVVGWVDREEVPEQLNRLRLQIVPSHPTEGLPTAIIEGMACGTPAYATPVSGVPDVVREGETGFLMDGADGETSASDIQEEMPASEVEGEAIAAKIESILEREDLDEISHNARELIETEYSFAGAVRRYGEIFDDLGILDTDEDDSAT